MAENNGGFQRFQSFSEDFTGKKNRLFEVGGDIGGVRKDWKRLAEVGGG